MIDNASILFSTIMVVFTIFRAARLDRAMPWFVKLTRSSPAKRGRTSHVPPEPR